MARHGPWRLIPKSALIGVFIGALLMSCVTVIFRAHTGQRKPASASATAASAPVQHPASAAAPRAVLPWVVGATPLPRRKDGFGVVRSTPVALLNRRLTTVDRLPPPASNSFQSTIGPAPPEVLARSSWKPTCPVKPEQLRYLTMSFRGFDARAHTGEMLVNADVAQTVVDIFKRLYAAGFPLEEMRITPEAELNLPPTGDHNNTEAFLCHPTRDQTRWPARAYGLTIGLNPFNNPYVKGDLVLPELASSYLNRDWVRSGMALEGGPAVTVFESVGWKWGGRWSNPVDFEYFTATGLP